MERYLLLFAFLGFLTGVGPMADDNPPAAKPEKMIRKDEKLRKELSQRFREDQEARKSIMALMGKLKTSDPAEIKKMDLPEVRKLNEIDRRNTARMKEILDKHGWPGNTLVNADGANAAWLLVQHADHDVAFQKRCLVLMEQAVKKGEASAGDWAYLTDRVRIAEKEKQLYGTQLREVDGK